MNGNNSDYVTETRWSCIVTVPLLCAFISRYQPDDVTPSGDRVQIVGVDGLTAGSAIQFQSSESCDEWTKAIQRNIAAQNSLSISLTNASLLEHDQVKTRDWVKCEKSGKIYESTLKILKGST